MSKKKRVYMAMAGCVFVLTAAVLLMLFIQHSRHTKESPLYLAVSSFQRGVQNWEAPAAYAEDSGEGLFASGMDALLRGDYARAQKSFAQALEAPGSDPALPAYLYFYSNQCHVYLDGMGDPETVSLALEAMGAYAPLADDTEMLWDLLSSISLSSEADAQAIALLEAHMQNAKNMNPGAWAWMKNYVALLAYNNEEYAGSIRNFYDVEMALEEAERTPEMERELYYAKEYIANIHFIFEDYEKAAALYQALIDRASDAGRFDTYGCYVNMASAYLELSDFEGARQAMRRLEEQIPYMEENLIPEIEASMNDVLANVCIEEGSYSEAASYLEKAEAYYRNHTGNAFLGGEYITLLTRCKYMFHTGAALEAQPILEAMIEDGRAAYYGMEKEIYELLRDIYEKTGQQEKLVCAYRKLLELDMAFTRTTQREYLEFSAYYRENNQLREENITLSHANVITTLGLLLILVLLVAALIFTQLLRTGNVTDQLTGVYNRKMLTQRMRAFKRTGTPARFGVAMMDIDYFKRYNDTYGHPAGDDVLREVAKVLAGSVRSKDMVIRYGGEEFLVLLRDLEAQTAEAVCQRIQERLKKRAIPHAASDAAAYITLSVGLCYQSAANAAALEKLIEHADTCLYQSKEAGRNRVTVKIL